MINVKIIASETGISYSQCFKLLDLKQYRKFKDYSARIRDESEISFADVQVLRGILMTLEAEMMKKAESEGNDAISKAKV